MIHHIGLCCSKILSSLFPNTLNLQVSWLNKLQVQVQEACSTATNTMESQSKSLQELSASRAVTELMKEEHPEASFRDLERIQQELLFTSLVKECKRLRSIEVGHRALQENLSRVPDADRFVHLGGGDTFPFRADLGPLLSEAAEDQEEESYYDPSEYNPFDRALQFRSGWQYATHEDIGRLEEDIFSRLQPGVERVHWHAFESSRVSDDSPVQYLTSDEKNAIYKRWDQEGKGDSRLTGFDRLISSQLLLYRTTVTLGPPPSDMMDRYLDGYKCCWHTVLVMPDERQGKIVNRLTLGEHKGAATCNFWGTKEGSQKALELLNYLLGKDCAHSYDAILAGRQA